LPAGLRVLKGKGKIAEPRDRGRLLVESGFAQDWIVGSFVEVDQHPIREGEEEKGTSLIFERRNNQ
jgi:hypothetical protein